MSPTATSPTALVWRRLLRHRLAQASLVFLAIMLVLSLAAPLIAELRHIDPATTDLLRRFEPPSVGHRLGTDDLGRDLFQRLLDGGRVCSKLCHLISSPRARKEVSASSAIWG